MEGTKSTSAFEACLRRSWPDRPFLQADIWTIVSGIGEPLGSVDEEDVPTSLKELEVPVGESNAILLVLRLSQSEEDDDA